MSTKKEALHGMEVELSNLVETQLGRRALLTSLPFLLASCASSNKSRHREGDNTGQSTSLTIEDERRMSREYRPQMSKEYPKVKNQYVQSHINHIGQKIVKKNNLGGNPYNYTFTAVESKMVNAFALPAGTVYVTTPLIKMAQSEAELAGVIGHEIGHIKARHTAERIEKSKKESTKSVLFGAIGGLIGGAAGFALGKAVCSKGDKECIKRIALYGGAAGVGGGLLIQKFAFMANSREDEMEADRIGFKAAMKANYHPSYVGNFYEKLLKMESAHKNGSNKFATAFSDALSTHPPGTDRVQQQREMSQQFNTNSGIITTKEFKKVKTLV